MADELARIWVAPELVTEFQKWREHLESKTGNKLNGGAPTISKICAEVLKRLREGDKKTFKIQVERIKGLNKSDVSFLFDGQ